MGVNHCDIGVYFARKWNFKDQIINVIENHHRTDKSAGLDVAIIRMANMFSKAGGMCFPWDNQLFNIMEESTWEILSGYAGQQFDTEQMVTELMEEAGNIKESVTELLMEDNS